jgi:hypothetical protein
MSSASSLIKKEPPIARTALDPDVDVGTLFD